MATYRVDDYKCLDCEHVEELLLDKDEKPACSECKSLNMKRLMSVGEGNTKHISWAKWRV